MMAKVPISLYEESPFQSNRWPKLVVVFTKDRILLPKRIPTNCRLGGHLRRVEVFCGLRLTDGFSIPPNFLKLMHFRLKHGKNYI